MNDHNVGPRDEWLAARLVLLEAEKAHTRCGDALGGRGLARSCRRHGPGAHRRLQRTLTAGPPPWFVYRLAAHNSTALGTVEPGGATRWRF
jgi:hypothetical protein